MTKLKATTEELEHRREAPLVTPTDLTNAATKDITGSLNAILADVFALYLKSKNFHWHMSGPHFRDYHLLLDDQADQLFAMTDPIAERIRKLGGTTLRSISHIARLQRIKDNDAAYVEPEDMLAELRDDNKAPLLACARPMKFAKGTPISLLPVSLRSGSTKLSGAYGFCSKPLVMRTPPGIRNRQSRQYRQISVIMFPTTHGVVGIDGKRHKLPDLALVSISIH